MHFKVHQMRSWILGRDTFLGHTTIVYFCISVFCGTLISVVYQWSDLTLSLAGGMFMIRKHDSGAWYQLMLQCTTSYEQQQHQLQRDLILQWATCYQQQQQHQHHFPEFSFFRSYNVPEASGASGGSREEFRRCWDWLLLKRLQSGQITHSLSTLSYQRNPIKPSEYGEISFPIWCCGGHFDIVR